MISVIICSINKKFAEQVQKNIAQTIGVIWEPIVIDNKISPLGITQVYNAAASKAQYDILCFVHEDILFQTQNWGVTLLNHFKNDVKLGLIGVAGSKYKSKTPSGWFTGCSELDCCNITHLSSDDKQQIINLNPNPGLPAQQVVVLDGVFLCCPKTIWEEVKFNDTLLKDFHLYDLDFSCRIAENYKVIVTFEINILHIVKGNHYGNSWLEPTLLWHKTMKKKLPAFLPTLDLRIHQFENKILRTWLIRLKHENINLSNRLRWLLYIRIWANISAWPFVFLFLFKNVFTKRQSK
ncbi:MAG: glycosyltransferase [Ferruginibacter sp.]